jgi:hypothetical protein
MARRGRSVPTPPEIPSSVDAATGISLLRRQMEKGRQLLEQRPLRTVDHTSWKNTTRDYLVKAFGSASPTLMQSYTPRVITSW